MVNSEDASLAWDMLAPEHRELVVEIAGLASPLLPEGWRHAEVEYHALGCDDIIAVEGRFSNGKSFLGSVDRSELRGAVKRSGVPELFRRLRSSTYRPGR